MTVKELYSMTFNEACEKLYQESDLVTTYESLKEYAIKNINEERLFLAIHILEAIQQFPADYYDYDYCMGTLENPTPLVLLKDLNKPSGSSSLSSVELPILHSSIGSIDIALNEAYVSSSRKLSNISECIST